MCRKPIVPVLCVSALIIGDKRCVIFIFDFLICEVPKVLIEYFELILDDLFPFNVILLANWVVIMENLDQVSGVDIDVLGLSRFF